MVLSSEPQRSNPAHSELLARATDNRFAALEDNETTDAINHAIAGLPADHAFIAAAASMAVRPYPPSSTTSGIPVSNQ
jgi:hypothetical protein